MTNRGQAMIEALILGGILTASISFLVRYALEMQQSMLVDELIEQTLLCEFEGHTDCGAKLKSFLTDLQFKQIALRITKSGSTYLLNVSGQSIFDQKFEKESELTLDLTTAN